MAINKVIYGGTTLIDLSGDSLASASQLMQGVTAHDRTGALITGTATGGGGSVTQDQDGYIVLPPDGGGGGGGLEYEEGTWTPSEDVTRVTINFADSHTTAPMFVILQDTTGTAPMSTTDNVTCTIANFHNTYGEVPYTSGSSAYGRLQGGYGGNYAGVAYNNLSSLSSVLSNSSFVASSNSTSRYWRAGRTYKWIAVWKPTT